MANTTFVKIANERRYLIEGQDAPDDSPLLETPHPLSLSMGPTVIWLNAIGNEEAQAITEEWRPRFTIRAATSGEESAWL